MHRYFSQSSDRRLVAAIATFLRYKKYLRDRNAVITGPLRLHERKAAELEVFRLVQRDHFSEELEAIEKQKRLSKTSSLRRFNPIVVDDLLRVGGRLGHAQLSFDARHPILLPPKSHITHLLIAEAHEKSIHGSARQIVNDLRERVWIPQLMKVVK